MISPPGNVEELRGAEHSWSSHDRLGLPFYLIRGESGGLSEQETLDPDEWRVKEKRLVRDSGKEPAKRSLTERLEINMPRAAMNPSNSAEILRWRNWIILPFERVSFCDEDWLRVRGRLRRQPAEHSVNKKAAATLEEHHVTTADHLHGIPADKYIVACADPGEHAGSQSPEAGGAVRADFLCDWMRDDRRP
jgi:hypothetical protein